MCGSCGFKPHRRLPFCCCFSMNLVLPSLSLCVGTSTGHAIRKRRKRRRSTHVCLLEYPYDSKQARWWSLVVWGATTINKQSPSQPDRISYVAIKKNPESVRLWSGGVPQQFNILNGDCHRHGLHIGLGDGAMSPQSRCLGHFSVIFVALIHHFS